MTLFLSLCSVVAAAAQILTVGIMAASSSAPFNLLTMSSQERVEEYEKMLVNLGLAGVPVKNYAYGDMLMMGYNLRTFRNAIRPFLVLPDPDAIIVVLTLLIQHQVIGPKEHMTFKDLVCAASWLKGTVGREALANLQHQRKLIGKAHGEMTAEEASLCDAFQQQLIDMAESNKILRAHYDEKINEYKLRKERDVALEQNMARFAPSTVSSCCQRARSQGSLPALCPPVANEPEVIRELESLPR